MKKIFGLILRLFVSLLIFAVLFKVMHWPYANTILLPAVAGILIFYSIRFLFKNQKNSLDYIKLIFVFTWSFTYLNSNFYFIQIPKLLEFIPLVLFAWWFINEGTSYFSLSKLKGNSSFKIFYSIFLVLTLGLVILGIILRILHWPYGALLFTLGMLLASIFVVIDFFAREKIKPLD